MYTKGLIPIYCFNLHGLLFYENGIIELHFGKLELDSSSIFDPNKGFILFDSPFGPTVGIGNDKQTESYFLSGQYDNPDLDINRFEDSTAQFLGVPPEGWIVRFTPSELVSLNSDTKTSSRLKIFPTITKHTVNWEFSRENHSKKKIFISDYTGRLIEAFTSYKNTGIINVSTYPDGIYFLQIITDDNHESTQKIIVNK